MLKLKDKKVLSIINMISAWLAIVIFTLLILPKKIIGYDLATYINEQRALLLFIFILAISNFISQGILFIINFLSNKFKQKIYIKEITTAITCLDFAERAVLREFILQRKSVINLPLEEPTIRNLLKSQILEITSNDTDSKGRQPMMINVKARPYITYRAIGLTKNKMTDEEVNQLLEARPKYALA
ncbi:MAG: super-infection exclusion protein B [Succinivibrionaceae bacterium]